MSVFLVIMIITSNDTNNNNNHNNDNSNNITHDRDDNDKHYCCYDNINYPHLEVPPAPGAVMNASNDNSNNNE